MYKLLLIVGLFILFVGCGPREVIIVTPTSTPLPPTPTRTPIATLTPVANIEEYREACRKVARAYSDSETWGDIAESASFGYETLGSLTPPSGGIGIVELQHKRLLNAFRALLEAAPRYPATEPISTKRGLIVEDFLTVATALNDLGCYES